MNRTLLIVLVLAVVLCAAGAACRLLLFSAGPPKPAPPEPEDHVSGAVEGPAAPPALEAPEPGPVPDPGPEATGLHGRRLSGRLTGYAPSTGEARLRVRAVMGMRGRRPEDIHATSDAEGRFALDLAPLFGVDAPAELEVRADHPDCLPATARVRVEGEEDLRVEIPLARAAVVEGRLTGEVSGVVVTLHRLEDGKPSEAPLDETVSDAAGRYRLRAGGVGRHLVVALSPNHAPASLVVSPIPDRITPAPDLFLEPGASLVGMVTMEERPLHGARIRAEMPAEGHRLRIGRVRLAYRDGVLAKRSLNVETEADGLYHLRGLSRGLWKVTVDEVPGVRLLSGFSTRITREVKAPATGVNFDITGARLILRVSGAGRPLATFGVHITSDRGMSGHYFRSGEEPVLLMAPGVEHQIRITAEGFEPHEMTIVAQEAGREAIHEVDLSPPPPRPTLVVAFESPHPVRRAAFGLYKVGVERGDMPNLLKADEEAGEDGHFHLTRLLPGRYVLVARPETTWFEARGHYLPVEAQVVLPERGEATVTLTARVGGRIRISARDGSGKAVAAVCRVLDTHGRYLTIRYVAEGAHGVSWSDEGLVEGVPNVVDPALVPGRYRVELTLEGHHPWSGEVAVEAGRTTEVKAMMLPR